jgi:transcriptional regulator with XRE-family HTH domain
LEAGDSIDIVERFQLLMRRLFQDNQSEAARYLRVSQPTISRVLNGRMKLGPKLIKAVAAHPRVNSDWFTTGKGESLNDDVSTELSVSKFLLRWMPSECIGILFGSRRPVAAEYYRESRYWYEVPEDSSISFRHGIRLTVPHDRFLQATFLLVESDRDFIERHVRQGALVAVKFDDQSAVFADLERFGDGFAAEPKVVPNTGARDGLTISQLAEVYLARESLSVPSEFTEEAQSARGLRDLKTWISEHPIEVALEEIVGIPILFERHLL